MYYDYFGLKQPPFKITPDTSLFFPGGNRGAILDALVYAIVNGEGITKVVGEVGSGKTMLCRMLEKELPDNVEVVYIANPSLSPEHILHAIAFDLKLTIQTNTPRLEVMNRLQEYLLNKHSSGQQVVVFIEEAQSMPIATLEEIRLLSNLETQQNKLLQIVLFGQPELNEMISQREIRQLKERITYSFQLNPFNSSDIRDYLNTRLRTCGYRSREIFNGKAIKVIKRYSKGLIRRINILADKSMLAAYASNTNIIDASHVRRAARDSEFINDWSSSNWQTPLVISISISMAILVCVFVFWQISFGSGVDKIEKRSTNLNQFIPALENPALIKQNETTGAASGVSSGELNVLQVKVSTDILDSGRVVSATMEKDKNPVNSDTNRLITGTDPGSQSTTQYGYDMAVTGPDNEIRPGNIGQASGINLEISEHLDDSGIASGRDGIENQIMGLEGVFGPDQMGKEQYTDNELQIMREQLEKLPPEVAYQQESSLNTDICKLCWSIIYRPIIESDKL